MKTNKVRMKTLLSVMLFAGLLCFNSCGNSKEKATEVKAQQEAQQAKQDSIDRVQGLAFLQKFYETNFFTNSGNENLKIQKDMRSGKGTDSMLASLTPQAKEKLQKEASGDHKYEWWYFIMGGGSLEGGKYDNYEIPAISRLSLDIKPDATKGKGFFLANVKWDNKKEYAISIEVINEKGKYLIKDFNDKALLDGKVKQLAVGMKVKDALKIPGVRKLAIEKKTAHPDIPGQHYIYTYLVLKQNGKKFETNVWEKCSDWDQRDCELSGMNDQYMFGTSEFTYEISFPPYNLMFVSAKWLSNSAKITKEIK